MWRVIATPRARSDSDGEIPPELCRRLVLDDGDEAVALASAGFWNMGHHEVSGRNDVRDRSSVNVVLIRTNGFPSIRRAVCSVRQGERMTYSEFKCCLQQLTRADIQLLNGYPSER